ATRPPWDVRKIGPSAHQEALELGRGVVEALATEAVVLEPALLGDRHEAGGAQEREMVLDGWLREFEALGDLGEVEVLVTEQAEDPQARVVAESAMQPQDRLRRR